MGRKRKIPEGYIPKWKTDSDSTDSENELHASQCHQRLDIDNAGDFPIQSRGNLDIPPIKSRKLSSDHVFANPITEESENIPGPQKEEQPEQIHTEEVQLEAHNESTDNEECLLHDLPLQEDAQQESPTYKYQADQLLPEDELSLCEDEDEEDGLYMEEDMEDLPLQEDVLPEALTDEFQADQHLPEDELPFSEEEEEEEEDDEEEEEEKEEEEEENKESFLYILKQFAEEWMGSEVNKRVSKRASSSLWNVAAKWMFQLTTAFVKDKKKKFPKLTHVRRKLVKKHVPPISLDTGFVNKETNELTLFSNSETTPSLDPQLHEKVFEIASIKV